jgi:hypothetical protein
METHAFGFRLRANAPEGQKQFPISISQRPGGPKAISYQYQSMPRRGLPIPVRQGSTLDVNFELFNIFNTANFANPTVDQRATDFLVLTALRGGNGQPRAAQVGVRFGF